MPGGGNVILLEVYAWLKSAAVEGDIYIVWGVRLWGEAIGTPEFIYLFIYLDIQRRPRDNQWLFLSRWKWEWV